MNVTPTPFSSRNYILVTPLTVIMVRMSIMLLTRRLRFSHEYRLGTFKKEFSPCIILVQKIGGFRTFFFRMSRRN